MVRFPSFDITYGKNDLNATIRLTTASNNQEYDAFFSGVFGKRDIELRLKADQTSSSSDVISPALDGLNFTTKASGAALMFVDSFMVSGSPQAPLAGIVFINPLGTNIAVTSLEMEIRRSASRQVLGNVAVRDVQGENIPPTGRKEISAPFLLRPEISEQDVSGAEELLTTGKIGLALGMTNIMINFEEEIPRVG